MLRLIVLVATLAVAQSTTLLYPSSYRQVAWPIQSQYPLSTVSLSPSLSYPVSNYYPYTTVYRYPLQYQWPTQYKYVQSTPLYTRTLPLLWSQTGRSYGEQSPAVPQQYAVPSASYAPASYAHQVNHPVAAPVSQPSYIGQAGYVSQSPAPVANFAQPSVQSGHFVSHVSASVPTQHAAYGSSPRSSQEPIAFENTYQVSPATYSPYGAAVSQPAVVHSFIAPNGAVAEPVTAYQQHQSAHIAGNQVHQVPAQSVPIAYSPSVQPSTGHIAQHIPIQQSTYVQPGQQHQESLGHHQVSHVTIPGQVGVGGGYSSAAFYETAPASVVIPSVPVNQEPIVAARQDVKHVTSKGEQVAHQQNLRVQTY